MKKRITAFIVCVLLTTFSFSSAAQQAGRIPRIGFLSTVSLSSLSLRLDAFRQGLRDLGYIEGENIII